MKAKLRTLYVLTHTESYDNQNRIFSGLRDTRLTPLGQRQAERMGKRLQTKKLGLAFISPLLRARQTLARIVKYHPGIKICADPRIVERDYGRLTGKSKPKYNREHPNLYRIHHRSYRVAPPGGESMVHVEKRALAFLRDVLRQMKEKQANAVIIGHSNSIRPIRGYFEKLTPEQMMKLDNRHKIFAYRVSL